MGFQEEVSQLNGKPIKKSECVFCTDHHDFFTDLSKDAYRIKTKKKIKHQDQSTCIHHKDDWLLDTNKTVGFMWRSFEDELDGKKENEIKSILLDDTKVQSLLMAFRERMFHYASAMNLYLGITKYDGDDIEGEAVRLDTQRKKEAVIYYDKAQECFKLTKEYIKNLDLTK